MNRQDSPNRTGDSPNRLGDSPEVSDGGHPSSPSPSPAFSSRPTIHINMKRKHGHMKDKSSGAEEACKAPKSIEGEDKLDVNDHDSDETETPAVTPVVAKPSSSSVGTNPSSSPVVANPSSSTVADQPTKPVISLPERPVQKPLTTAVYGRVKVRLKAPKVLEPQVTSADIPFQSDTHSSSGHQKSVEKQDSVMDKIEDSANSSRDAGAASGENPSAKAQSDKIKNLNSLVSLNTNQSTDVSVHKEDKPKHEEPKLPHQDPRYNKKELDASLEVVKKVMKMDAAEPFNVPVNPVELGIPDYFDVIDTPMDFGTVRKNLESGTKYINSESVLKDVRYIWDNCYKYNNKGDYIVDLMKRVKKNFMKYWAAASLYSDHKKGNGVEGNHGSDVGSSSQDKKQKKGKGLKKHKDGCLCAICAMKRRRKEREQREAQETRELKGQDIHTSSGMSDLNPAQGVESEENTPIGNQGGDEISSSVENSQDADGDEEVEDVTEDIKSEAAVKHNSAEYVKNKADIHDNASLDVSEASHGGNRTENGSYQTSEPKLTSDLSPVDKTYTDKRQIEAHTSTLQKRKIELIEAEKERQKSELYKRLGELESETLSGLCKTLFPEKHNSSRHESVWEGPHSLLYRKKPHTNSDIFTALSSFMSPPPPTKRVCK